MNLKRLMCYALSFLLMVSLVSVVLWAPLTAEAAYQNTSTHTIVSQKNYTIVEGMTETTLVLNDKSGNRIDGHMISIAPGAPVTAKANYPGYYKAGSTPTSRAAYAENPVWKKQTTTGQAADYVSVTKQPVLFAMNSDNFITEATVNGNNAIGQPCGYLIMEGNALQTTELTNRPFFAVLKDGSFVIREAGSNLSDVVEATSGRKYLIKDGKNVVSQAQSDSLGLQPFNSIGLKADGTLVTFLVDGRRSDSVGMTEMEMANYLLAQGVHTALILDGGGSATFASRRSGESKLTLRNKPSDGSERALGATLMFVPGDPSLFFDFGNTTRDQSRYSSYVYEKTNHDTTAMWRATAGASDSVSVNNSAGTLTLKKDASNTLSYFYTQSWSGDSADRYKLHFRPDYAEYLQVRMTLSGFSPATSNSSFSMHYYADGATAQSTNAVLYSFGSGYGFDGSSILLTLPIAQKFRDAQFIDSIKMNFSNLSGAGTVVFDYIYIGPKNSLPEQDHLFFDFGNHPTDARRYNSKTYSFQNYDLGSWGYNGKKCTAPQLGGDLLSFQIMDTTDDYVNTGHSPYIQTSDSSGNLALPVLNYSPGKEDYLQIRFKMENCKAVPNLVPTLRFYYAADEDTTFAGNVRYDLSTEEMTSGKFCTITLPLHSSAAYQAASRINLFRLNFQNVCNGDGKTGKIAIDYIYIGGKASLPRQDQLLIGFDNKAADKLRYDSKTYGYHNYDEGCWGYNKRKSSTPQIANGTMTFEVLPTTDQYNATGHSPYMQTSDGSENLATPVLWYSPGKEDYLQIRFKMQGCAAVSGTSPALRFYFATGDSTTFAGNVKKDLTAAEMTSGSYITATIPLHTLSAYQTAERLNLFRLNFQNVRAADGQTGIITLDYIYVGARNTMPTPQYTVTFKDAAGKTLATQAVYKGESAVYTGATPTKAADASYHYTFKGWDKALTNITADTTITATYTATAHSYTYIKVDAANHKATCSCGYSKTTAHGWNSGSVTTQPTCTAAGVKTYTCSTCKATKTEAVAALGHSYTAKITAPTCTAQGYTTHTCSCCSNSYKDTYVAEKGHTEVIDKAVAATCTTAGKTEGKHCSVCKIVLVAQQTVPATGHSYIYTKINALSHGITCENCSYSSEASHSYKNGFCICGEPEIKEPVVNTSMKLNHSLNLASDISVNLLISKSLLEGFDMTTVYVESTIDTYEGNTYAGTTVTRIEAVENGNYYYFTLNGLTAVQMNDGIFSVIYGTKDGQPYRSPVDVYSIATYAYTQMNHAERPEALKRLCAELLRYGSKAQIFKSYRTDALADANMTSTHKAYLSDIEAVTFGNINRVLNDLSTPTITWAGKSLDLQSKVTLKFVFSTANYTGKLSDLSLHVSYTGLSGKTQSIVSTELEDYDRANHHYAFSFCGLLAAELRSVISVQVYEGNTPVSPSLQYSADTYGANKEGTLLTLCKALLAYSDSAKAYFVNN